VAVVDLQTAATTHHVPGEGWAERGRVFADLGMGRVKAASPARWRLSPMMPRVILLRRRRRCP
jgi:hypothetical protein